MVRLFVSDRIFNENRLFSAAIPVNKDGKIGELLKNQVEIDKWLKVNRHAEVIQSARKLYIGVNIPKL